MIFIWHLIGLMVLFLRMNETGGSTNSTSRTFVEADGGLRGIGGIRGIDESLDSSWQRYLNQLRRLKLHEMKKTIRSRVRTEKFYPYFSLKHIRRRLKLLEMFDPTGVEVGYVRDASRGNSIHRTLAGQGILYVKISEADATDRDQQTEGKTSARPIALLVAGIGGSDWTAVHATMQVATELATSYEKEKLSGHEWWIIPLLNPDGYVNSMDNKIRRYYKANVNPTGGCSGVNLDVNFLVQRNSCRDGRRTLGCRRYPGEFPFSEVESRALRDFISARAEDCELFVAVKEGAKALVYPFASASTSPPGAYTTLQDLICVEALEAFDQSHRGMKNLFRFGNSGSIFGLSSGFVEDWAKRHMGIARSFAFYITDREGRRHESADRLEEYGKGTLKVVRVLATSRRVERYAESFEELINQRRTTTEVSKTRKRRPKPWGRELVHEHLRDKIHRGVDLEMPMELTNDDKESQHLDF